MQPDRQGDEQHGASIKVLRFLYTVGGREYSESLVNKHLAPNETEDWPSQTLRNAAIAAVTHVQTIFVPVSVAVPEDSAHVACASWPPAV